MRGQNNWDSNKGPRRELIGENTESCLWLEII